MRRWEGGSDWKVEVVMRKWEYKECGIGKAEKKEGGKVRRWEGEA